MIFKRKHVFSNDIFETIERRDEDRLRVFVERVDSSGMDVRNELGQTPLMAAAERGHHQAVNLLLPKSNPNAVDHDGDTALTLAAITRQWDCVRALIPVTDVSQQNTQGMDAVMLFCTERHLASLALALALHPFHENRDAEGWTALMHATLHHFTAGVELLIPVSDVNAVNHHQGNALQLAVSSGSLPTVQMLLPHTRLWGDQQQPLWDLKALRDACQDREAALACCSFVDAYFQAHQDRHALSHILHSAHAEHEWPQIHAKSRL